MVLFRMEDPCAERSRTIDDLLDSVPLEKKYFDESIAQMIREEVNGTGCRSLLSFSKSLAVCLLKYNEGSANELHICYIPCALYDNHRDKDYVEYISPRNNWKSRPYSISGRLFGKPFFKKNGKVDLCNFVVDVGNNNQLDQYLKFYTNYGLDPFASPEKDREVVMVNLPDNAQHFVLRDFIEAVYVLYALRLRFDFSNILYEVFEAIKNINDDCFPDLQEKRALLWIIKYLEYDWHYEHDISKKIYKYPASRKLTPYINDQVSLFDWVKSMTLEDFEIWLNAFSDNDNIVTEIIKSTVFKIVIPRW